MKRSPTLIGRFALTLGFILVISAEPATAATVNIQVSGTVPLASSANDFHIRVAIANEFLLGEPINLVNGPFAADGVVNSTDTGFTVDWAGVTVNPPAGPFEFGFDFVVNGPWDLTEAWWTINGTQNSANMEGLFNFQVIPEPASLALFAMGGVLLLRRRSTR